MAGKKIEGVELIPLKTNVDDRGYLIVLASVGRPDAFNVPVIREVYFVGNFGKGVIRAFHKHEKLVYYFFIGHGAAKFVLVDDREDSLTYADKCFWKKRFVVRHPHAFPTGKDNDRNIFAHQIFTSAGAC